MSFFRTNMAISEMKGHGVESHHYPVKEGQRYIKLNPKATWQPRDSSFVMPYALMKFQWNNPQTGCQIQVG